jgi:hypothetical protein
MESLQHRQRSIGGGAGVPDELDRRERNEQGSAHGGQVLTRMLPCRKAAQVGAQVAEQPISEKDWTDWRGICHVLQAMRLGAFPVQNFQLMLCVLAAAGVACTEPGSTTQSPTNTAGNATAGNAGTVNAAVSGGSGVASGGGSQGGSLSTGGVSDQAGAGSGAQAGAGGVPVPEPDDFFGESRCAQSGLLLCDGFEGAAIDTALWEVQKTGDNVVELSAAQAARGTKSLRIQASNGFGFVRNESIFPVPNNDYYGRMFVWVRRFSTVAWAHWTLAEAEGTGNGHRIRVGGQYDTGRGENRWGVGSDGGPTGDWTTRDDDPNGSPDEPPENAWVCLEWLHQGSENITRFYVNGDEHPSLATTAQDHGGSQADYVLPQFTNVWVGWWQYQDDPEPFELWIDEVAFDEQRIGCFK